MTDDPKKLLRKKRYTGADVGRLLLADLVLAYKNNMLGLGDKGLLTLDDKVNLVNNLASLKYRKDYSDFKAVFDYVCQIPLSYMAFEKDADADFWKLYHIIEKTREAETAAGERFSKPRIVTQAQFDAIKAADFEEKMTRSLSMEALFFDAVTFYFRMHEDGLETPLGKHFEATKGIQITNPRLKEFHGFFHDSTQGYHRKVSKWAHHGVAVGENAVEMAARRAQATKNAFTGGQEASVEQVLEAIRERKKRDEAIAADTGWEWVDDPRGPKNATMYDVLTILDFFYCSEATGRDDTFHEVEQDLPDLYKAVWGHLIATTGLAFIKNFPREEYINGPSLVPVKILYENDILDYRKTLGALDPCPLGDFGGGFAILQEGSAAWPDYIIDENGHYKDLEDTHFTRHRAEVLIDKYGEKIREWLDKITSGYRDMYAIHTFLAITGEFVGVSGLESFINPIDETKIEALNALFEEFPGFLFRHRGGSDESGPRRIDQLARLEQLTEKINSLLRPISLSSLQPTEEQIQRARATISFDTFKGGARNFVESLARREEAK
jgi:hypothetical protein